jgi:hypothetical protein
MLFLSERSWKHHFVTLLLPYTYLMAQFTYSGLRLRARLAIAAAMWASVLMMATTSSELGGLLAHGQGHKLAQGYGLFLWAAVLLYAVTALRVFAERDLPAAPRVRPVPPKSPPSTAARYVPPPHFSDLRSASPPR